MSRTWSPNISHEQDISARLDYPFFWELEPGDFITQHSIVAAQGLFKERDSRGDTEDDNIKVVQAWFFGGEVDTEYPVECMITTNDGRIDKVTVIFKIISR